MRQMTMTEEERRERKRAKNRAWYEANRKKALDRSKAWRAENRERVKARNRKWREENPERAREHYARKQAARNQTPRGRIEWAIRGAARRIKRYGGGKLDSSVALLGCTLEEARAHIEGQFAPGMTWENHGEWHIDHIRPLASFDLTDPEQVQAASHYTNLQPLWASDNISKGASFEA